MNHYTRGEDFFVVVLGKACGGNGEAGTEDSSSWDQ